MAIYVVGAITVFTIHVLYLQMVTTELAALRAVVWPYFIVTGRPSGTPLSMD